MTWSNQDAYINVYMISEWSGAAWAYMCRIGSSGAPNFIKIAIIIVFFQKLGF